MNTLSKKVNNSQKREALIEWVNSFLNRLEGIDSGHSKEMWIEDPGTTIVDAIINAHSAFEQGEQNWLISLPSLESLFRSRESAV